MLRFPSKFFSRCLNTKERKSWLKQVDVELIQLDLDLDKRRRMFITGIAQLEPFSTDPSGLYHSAGQGEAIWHFVRDLKFEYQNHLIQNQWPVRLAPILDGLELEKLYAEIKGSTCTNACCWLTGPGLEAFMKGFANGLPNDLIAMDCREDDGEVKQHISLWTEEREKRRRHLGEERYREGYTHGYYFDRTEEQTEKRQRRRRELSEAEHRDAQLSQEFMERHSSEGTWGNFGVRASED